MKPFLAAIALAASLVTMVALAQDQGDPAAPSLRPNAKPKLPFSKTPNSSAAATRTATAKEAAPPTDTKVLPANAVLPGLTPPDQIKPATITLPNDPIEPYLLTKDNGPFMVMARSFRGPDAERYALALVLELRNVYHLPAYILRTKDFPHNSNIRNVPPTAPPAVNKPFLTNPEKVRTYDEALVLVGDEKTEAGSKALLQKVKHIKPKCLDEIPSPFGWRKGLTMALRTTNPFASAQNLFPGRKKDPLITQMNDSPRSIIHCPGRYSLQVAEFGGRATFNMEDQRFQGIKLLEKSPLATAAANAEKLADVLAKDPEISRAGYQPYVYHDRTSSRVTIGSFNAPNEPAAVRLRDTLLRKAVELSHPKKAGVVIAPAPYLTDLEPIKSQLE